ncbi:MAG: 50S ribosomal protein L23 [bacterium]
MALFSRFKKSAQSAQSAQGGSGGELAVPPLKEEVVKTNNPPAGGKKPAKKIERKGRKIAHEVLIRPLITEKASGLAVINQYVFSVAPQANKIEIKKAIEELYGVSPIAVNIIKMRGKNVRSGRTQGQTKNWKKAIVTLKKGESIKVYEV